MEKAVLGLSDGVDSAVAAYILRKQGYEVFGLYLDISGRDNLESAQRNAAQLEIPLRIVDAHELIYERVCKPFIDEYLHGRTPNPCPDCNRNVKLPALITYADEIGARYIATGHYVRKSEGRLFRGSVDNDQSYMLARLTTAQVNRLLLPLGDKNKARVRALALKLGLDCAKRPDSRENCFAMGQHYDEWLENSYKGLLPPKGEVYYNDTCIAAHAGIYHYTVGQHFCDDPEGRRLYVSHIDAKTNSIMLCQWDELFTAQVELEGLTWLSGSAPGSCFDGEIRVRHTRRETPACHVEINENGASVQTLTPLRAPVPGQPAALYIGDELIGGGYVK